MLKRELTICSPTSDPDMSTYIIPSKILFKAGKRAASKEKKQQNGAQSENALLLYAPCVLLNARPQTRDCPGQGEFSLSI
jgi:hypothetical protein